MTHLKVGYAYISIFLTPSYCGRVYDRRTTGVKTRLLPPPAHRPERSVHIIIYQQVFTTTNALPFTLSTGDTEDRTSVGRALAPLA